MHNWLPINLDGLVCIWCVHPTLSHVCQNLIHWQPPHAPKDGMEGEMAPF